MRSRVTWVAIGVALAFLVLVIVASVSFWGQIGQSHISAGGWLAMIFGAIVTLALGIGLMTLMFVSSRRGYDDPDQSDPPGG
ncbi:MAG: hypothetical protein JO267_10750 [Alphaproteobacteria bacterium]|nr:hypothetical protein [Alphaproteobacteria bacterium]